jgi:type III secretion system chaperone SycN
MSWVDNAIRDFGRGMGMEALTLNDEGLLCLDFETTGRLYIERAENAVLVYLVRMIPQHDNVNLQNALALCHYREGLSLTVNAGFGEENRLVFIARVPERDFSLSMLEKTIELLTRLHQKVFEGGG